MPYTVNGIPLAGFAVVLPFKFQTGGALTLLAENAFSLVQLRLSPSTEAAFPQLSLSMAELGTTTWVFADNHGNESFRLESFNSQAAISSQATGIGETLVLINGQASTATKITLTKLPSEEFPFFMKDSPPRFSWGAELTEGEDEGEDVLLKIADTVVDFETTARYVRSFCVSGPTRVDGCVSVFEWLVSKGLWYADGHVPQPANPLSKVTLHDLRRKTKLAFFANGPLGIAQVAGAAGAVFFANGSFARQFNLLKLRSLAQASLTGVAAVQDSLSSFLQPPSLDAAMLDDSQISQLTMDVLHEGLMVWNLQPRKNGKSFEEGLPAFL